MKVGGEWWVAHTFVVVKLEFTARQSRSHTPASPTSCRTSTTRTLYGERVESWSHDALHSFFVSLSLFCVLLRVLPAIQPSIPATEPSCTTEDQVRIKWNFFCWKGWKNRENTSSVPFLHIHLDCSTWQ